MSTTNRDAIHLIRDANPVPDPDRTPDVPVSLMEEIIGMTETHQYPDSPAPYPRRSRRRLAALIAVAVLATAGVAAATTWLVNPEDTTEIACGGEVIIPARSGDPVADCAAELDRRGIAYGELEAYANTFGGVVVTDAASDGLTPLGDSFTQDAALIRLGEMLNDHVDGLESRCFAHPEAMLLTAEYMSDLGLGLPVNVRSPELAATHCAVAIVNADEVIIAMDVAERPDSTETPPWTAFIGEMTTALESQCLSLQDAIVLADSTAIATGIGSMTQVDAVDDPALECTELNVEVGGMVFAVLRGPSTGDVPASVLPTDE